MSQLSSRRAWTAVLIATVAFGAFAVGSAVATYSFGNLPSGISEVSVDEGVLEDGRVLINTRTPTFRGTVDRGVASLPLTIEPDPVTYTVPIDPATGIWEFTLPAPIDLGSHKLFFGGEFIGDFQVVVGPLPADTGDGADLMTGGSTSSPLSGMPAPIVFLALLALSVVGVRQLSRLTLGERR